MSKENSEGVWRTIRGRRIFIGKGEDLATAMKNSGKFSRDSLRQDKDIIRYKDRSSRFGKNDKTDRKSRNKIVSKNTNTDNDYWLKKNNQAEKNRINENEPQRVGNTREQKNYFRYSEADRRELSHEKIQKKLADYKANTMSKNIGGWTIKQEDDMQKEGRQARESIYQQGQKEKSRKAIEDYKAKKQSNNKIESQDMPYERDLQDVVKSLNDEGSDFSWSINEYKDGKASLNVGVFMPDERGYVDRDVEFDLKGIKGNTAEGYSQIEDKIREWQDKHSSPDSFYDDDLINSPELEKIVEDKYNKARKQASNELNIDINSSKGKDFIDLNKRTNEILEEQNSKEIANIRKATKKDEKDWLPKATEIKEQGKSNRKEVSDNIQAHILEHYGPDYTGDDSISAEQAFIDQMDAMSWLPNNWKRGEEIAKGGSYLVYNGDMADFLDSLKINPKGKKFSEDKAFNTYVSLVGRESAKLYDKIKKHQAETINNYKKRKGK